MELTLFHGGKDIDKTFRFGYQPSGGVNRYQHGTGLYLTSDIQIAQSYAKGSRSVFKVQVDLDPSTEISNIKIGLDRLDQAIYELYRAGMGKATSQKLKQYFIEKFPNGDVPLVWLVNNMVNNNLAKRYAKTINEIVISNGCTYEKTRFKSEDLYIIYDFRVIKSVSKA